MQEVTNKLSRETVRIDPANFEVIKPESIELLLEEDIGFSVPHYLVNVHVEDEGEGSSRRVYTVYSSSDRAEAEQKHDMYLKALRAGKAKVRAGLGGHIEILVQDEQS